MIGAVEFGSSIASVEVSDAGIGRAAVASVSVETSASTVALGAGGGTSSVTLGVGGGKMSEQCLQTGGETSSQRGAALQSCHQ